MHVNIEINDLEIAEAVVDSRYFASAVEAVVENMDLNDILDAPSRSDVEIIVEDMGVPTSDDVYDIAREVVREEARAVLDADTGKQVIKEIIKDTLADLGVSHAAHVPLKVLARIEALEQQVLRLEGTLARVADVLLGKPVEQIVSDAIAEG